MGVKFLCEPLFLPTSSYSSVLLSVKGKQKLPPPRWIRPTRSTGASGAHWSEKFPSTARRIEQTSSDQTTERRPSLPRNCPFFMHLQSETLQTHKHTHTHIYTPYHRRPYCFNQKVDGYKQDGASDRDRQDLPIQCF